MDKKIQTTYMLSVRDPPQNKRSTQAKNEGKEKNILNKRTWKKSWGSNTYIRQKDFKTKAITKDKHGHYIILKGVF